MSERRFLRVTDSQQACRLLFEHGKAARLLAGGTDLMVAVNRREFEPEVLIFLGDAGLDYIRGQGGETLLIGAATPFAKILESDLIKEKSSLLYAAVTHLGSPAIRNAGTIGGNLANASPAADSAPPLLALGASLKLVSASGTRRIPVAEFFTGPGETVLAPDEMIVEVEVPAQDPAAKWAYRRLGKRKAQSLAVASVAIYCPFSEGKVRGARIAMGSVAPTPLLAMEAARLMEGKTLDERLIDQVADAAVEATAPVDDTRGSAWYRRRASRALVKSLLSRMVG